MNTSETKDYIIVIPCNCGKFRCQPGVFGPFTMETANKKREEILDKDDERIVHVLQLENFE